VTDEQRLIEFVAEALQRAGCVTAAAPFEPTMHVSISVTAAAEWRQRHGPEPGLLPATTFKLNLEVLS
jgi:hypothetical protein